MPRFQRARGSRFVMLVAGLLVSGLIGLLLLNLSMQKGAFELAGLQAETVQLQTAEQSLAFDLERLESTMHLDRRAAALGMVPNANPVFLDLTDGSVVGRAVPAAPGVVPAPPDPVVDPPRHESPATEPSGEPDAPADRTGAEPPTGPTDDRVGADSDTDAGGTGNAGNTGSPDDSTDGDHDTGTGGSADDSTGSTGDAGNTDASGDAGNTEDGGRQ